MLSKGEFNVSQETFKSGTLNMNSTSHLEPSEQVPDKIKQQAIVSALNERHQVDLKSKLNTYQA